MGWGDIWPLHTSGPYAPLLEWFPLTAAQTFLPGEVVRIAAAGSITEAATRPAATNVVGISATSGDTTGAETFRANTVYPGGTIAGAQVPANGLPATNLGVAVWLATPHILWATRNFTSAGAAFGDVTPTFAEIGNEAALALIAGVWGIDISGAAADADICRIHRVLDVRGRDIAAPGVTLVGSIVVFSIAISQLTAGTTTLGRVDAPA